MVNSPIDSKMSNITQKWVYAFLPYLKNYSLRLSESEISRKSGVPQQTVSRIVGKFVDRGILDFEKKGRNKLFFFKDSYESKTIFKILENFNALGFSSKKVFPVIEDLLSSCEALVVFGSYAKAKEKKESDLDLVVFGEANKRAIKRAKNKANFEINEHYFGFDEFLDLLRKKDSFALEVLDSHVAFGNVSKVVDVFWGYCYGKN